MFKDKILDIKYEVVLRENSYTDHEYGDYREGQTKILAAYKDRVEAQVHLDEANEFIEKTQKKYRGKISYFIRPMYLREHVTLVWTQSNKSEAETQAALSKLFPPKNIPTRNVG
jgi:hypothetical protein